MTTRAGPSVGMRYVLVHSPSVGPTTWRPVAEVLRRTRAVTLVDLDGVADAGPDFAGFITRRVVECATRDDASEPLVVATHSNCGYFAPLIADALDQASYAVAALLFVDAGIPDASGTTDLAGEFIVRLRELAVHGVLPRWTDWWPADVVEELVPDAHMRAEVVADQPQLPMRFYETPVITGKDWTRRRCGFVWFAPPYDEQAAVAAGLGWPVERVPGQHLHLVVDAEAVTKAMIAVVQELMR